MSEPNQKSPKQRDENAKDKKRQVPIELDGVEPEQYPERQEQSPKQ